MKKVLTGLGLVAACAACCAIPLAVPAIAALLASGGIGLAMGWDTLVCGAILAAAAVLLWRWRANQVRAKQAEAAGGCGCSTPAATASPKR